MAAEPGNPLAEAVAALLSRTDSDLWTSLNISKRYDGYVMLEDIFSCQLVKPLLVHLLPEFAALPNVDEQLPTSVLPVVRDLLSLVCADGHERFQAYNRDAQDFGGWLRVSLPEKHAQVAEKQEGGGFESTNGNGTKGQDAWGKYSTHQGRAPGLRSHGASREAGTQDTPRRIKGRIRSYKPESFGFIVSDEVETDVHVSAGAFCGEPPEKCFGGPQDPAMGSEVEFDLVLDRRGGKPKAANVVVLGPPLHHQGEERRDDRRRSVGPHEGAGGAVVPLDDLLVVIRALPKNAPRGIQDFLEHWARERGARAHELPGGDPRCF